jgi:hypothetical protein
MDNNLHETTWWLIPLDLGSSERNPSENSGLPLSYPTNKTRASPGLPTDPWNVRLLEACKASAKPHDELSENSVPSGYVKIAIENDHL